MDNVKEFQQRKVPSAMTWNYMAAGNFLIDLQDFFFARRDRVHPENVSRQYAFRQEQVDYFYDKLKAAALNDDEQFALRKLYSHVEDMLVEAGDISYRAGFSDGIRFVMHTLTMAGI